MGSGCCRSKCCKKPLGEPPIGTSRKNVATSPIARPLKNVGTLTMPEPTRSQTGTQIKVIQKTKIDVTSLDQLVQGVVFSEIVDAAISLDIDTTTSSSQEAPSSTKPPLNERQKSDWKEKYFIHGLLSDIVADVDSKTHGCINSSISEGIDIGLSWLHQLNIKVEEILKDRGSKILWKEKKYIQQIIVERDKLVQRTLTEGRSYAEQYEGHYRELIEEFIKKLEMEISLHLDELQKGIETDKESIFNESYKKIELITGKADNARIDIHRLLQVAAVMKREELMKMIDARYKDKTSQHLGYEQFRTLNLQVYSTVGSKKDGQGCEVIPVPTRQEFINEINNAKPHQPAIKRTVYLKSEFTRQQANL